MVVSEGIGPSSGPNLVGQEDRGQGVRQEERKLFQAAKVGS